jgi:hypothetical protein
MEGDLRMMNSTYENTLQRTDDTVNTEKRRAGDADHNKVKENTRHENDTLKPTTHLAMKKQRRSQEGREKVRLGVEDRQLQRLNDAQCCHEE